MEATETVFIPSVETIRTTTEGLNKKNYDDTESSIKVAINNTELLIKNNDLPETSEGLWDLRHAKRLLEQALVIVSTYAYNV